MKNNKILDRDVKRYIKSSLRDYIKPAYYYLGHGLPLKEYQEIQVDIELLAKFVTKQILKTEQKIVESIKNDLEIVEQQIGEGETVGILGSKKKSEFIDTQEKLDTYFESLITKNK